MLINLTHLAKLKHNLKYIIVALFLLFFINNDTFGLDFSTNFESTNFNTIQDFSIVDNTLMVSFSGGTSFRIGNGLLYHSGTKSWMIDPPGTTSRGTSTGSGSITFNPAAMSVDFFIRTSNSNSTGQVQIHDQTGAVIEDITSDITSAGWLHIEKTLNTGDAAITSIIVTAFGNNMLT